jgi:hypothetical protein
MKFFDNFKGTIRGEFEVIAKNKKGEIVHTYRDNNVVVDDARPATAFLLCQAIQAVGGATRPEFDGDGFDNTTDFVEKTINPRTFQVSFIKLAGGFPRKRSYCNLAGEEIPLAPAELISSGGATRSSLFVEIPFGSTLTDTVPTSWTNYGGSTINQPYHTSSLLYPRKTDSDVVDRDFAWSKRITNYSYTGTPTTTTFRADFLTTMRFNEGNGPAFDCTGQREGENSLYEYREAGLFVGRQPWQFNPTQSAEADVIAENATARHPKAVLGDIFGVSNLAGDIDSTLTGNLREYRYWDGHSELLGASYAVASTIPDWPKFSENKYTWESGLSFRNNFKSIDGVTTNADLQGELYEGHYMVARKTFPVLTKTKDLEFSIKWSLVFG